MQMNPVNVVSLGSKIGLRWFSHDKASPERSRIKLLQTSHRMQAKTSNFLYY